MTLLSFMALELSHLEDQVVQEKIGCGKELGLLSICKVESLAVGIMLSWANMSFRGKDAAADIGATEGTIHLERLVSTISGSKSYTNCSGFVDQYLLVLIQRVVQLQVACKDVIMSGQPSTRPGQPLLE
jgi:hypothetical protein